MVQVEPLSDWLPASAGLPMSAQLQPEGQPGGGGAAAWMRTLSSVTVLSAVALVDVTASPARSVGVMLRLTLDPGTAVQLAPSDDVAALNVLPARDTRRNTGALPVV